MRITCLHDLLDVKIISVFTLLNLHMFKNVFMIF